MQSYHIDLLTILRILSQQSGELRATVKHVPGIKETCHARVILVLGKVTTCSLEVMRTRQQLASGEEALARLQRLGELDWTYTPAPTSPSLRQAAIQAPPPQERQPAPHSFALCPYRTRSIGMEEFASWSYAQRSVYSMIDGRKSIEDIARILSSSRERIYDIVSAFYTAGAVAF